MTLGCSLVLLKWCVLISDTARQNCRYERYCSAFGDVDASFGSLGSFFSPRFAPRRGCFEANPPFVPILMQNMVDKMESLLAAASGGEAAGGGGGGGGGGDSRLSSSCRRGRNCPSGKHLKRAAGCERRCCRCQQTSMASATARRWVDEDTVAGP